MQPRRDRRCFTPRVCKLNSDLLVLCVRELDDLAPRLRLFVVPDTRVLRRDATLGRDRSGFSKGETRTTGEDTANCIATE